MTFAEAVLFVCGCVGLAAVALASDDKRSAEERERRLRRWYEENGGGPL